MAKALKGFGGRSVLEIVEDFDGSTYRAVYTVRFAGVIYLLHAFQKKSKKGIATPKPQWTSSSHDCGMPSGITARTGKKGNAGHEEAQGKS